MKENHSGKVSEANPKKYFFKSLISLLFLIVAAFSFVLAWEPTISYITARVFLVIGFCSIITSGLFAVYILNQTIQYLKTKADIFTFISLGISSIIIIGIITFVIKLFS